MASILVVDDEKNILEAFKILLEDKYTVFTCDCGEKVLKLIDTKNIDIVLLDIIMPDIDGIEVLKRIKEKVPTIDVIMITATNTAENAVKAMKLGAYDYVVKPIDKDYILMVIERLIEKRSLKRENIILKSEVFQKSIIGKSEEIKKVLEMIKKVGVSDSTVLINGESGVGKELVARAIHNNSLRKDKPFVVVNCPAIPSELVESELFGHEKGAFTSATTTYIGKFEFANEGTIFLDEISSLSQNVQAKLLRVLQEKEIVRIGSNKIINVNVRIIASTNIDLGEAVKQGKFREDLYYRINVVPIYIPPLRERKDDIELLANYFLEINNKKLHKNIKGFSKEVLLAFKNYEWPGNVRELENIIERLVVLIDKDRIEIEDIPIELTENFYKIEKSGHLRTKINDYEKEFILKILKKNENNKTKTAKELGIHRNTLIKKLKEYSQKPDLI